MGYLAVLENIMMALQVVVLILVIVFSAGLMKKAVNGAFPAFFTFAMLSYMLSDLYNIIYTFLRPEDRLPFAADEIAECAALLLLIAGIEAISKEQMKTVSFGSLIFSLLFTGANIALWIVWSGEWMQDIVFGLPYFYLIYLLVAMMKRSDAMSETEMIATLMPRVALLLLHVFQIFVTKPLLGSALDATCFALEIGVTEWFFWKTWQNLQNKEKESGEKALYLSVTALLWTVLVTYMNDGVLYVAAVGVNTMTLPLMLAAAKRLPGDKKPEEMNPGEKKEQGES